MNQLVKILERIRNFRINILNYDVFLQICTVLLAVIHIVLGITLGIAHKPFLSLLNIPSVICYMIAFGFARKNLIRVVYHIVVVEVLVYSYVSVYVLGNETLFSHYCLALMPFTYLTSYVLQCQNQNREQKVFHPLGNFLLITMVYLGEQVRDTYQALIATIESLVMVFHTDAQYFH